MFSVFSDGWSQIEHEKAYVYIYLSIIYTAAYTYKPEQRNSTEGLLLHLIDFSIQWFY